MVVGQVTQCLICRDIQSFCNSSCPQAVGGAACEFNANLRAPKTQFDYIEPGTLPVTALALLNQTLQIGARVVACEFNVNPRTTSHVSLTTTRLYVCFLNLKRTHALDIVITFAVFCICSLAIAVILGISVGQH